MSWFNDDEFDKKVRDFNAEEIMMLRQAVNERDINISRLSKTAKQQLSTIMELRKELAKSYVPDVSVENGVLYCNEDGYAMGVPVANIQSVMKRCYCIEIKTFKDEIHILKCDEFKAPVLYSAIVKAWRG